MSRFTTVCTNGRSSSTPLDDRERVPTWPTTTTARWPCRKFSLAGCPTVGVRTGASFVKTGETGLLVDRLPPGRHAEKLTTSNYLHGRGPPTTSAISRHEYERTFQPFELPPVSRIRFGAFGQDIPTAELSMHKTSG